MDEQQLGATVARALDETRECPIPLGISNRHIHLCAEDYGHLSPNHPTSEKKGLSQPRQYVAEQVATLVGPKGQLKDVRLFGPLCSTSQVETSRTDVRTLGITAPLRISDNIQNTSGVRLVSPFAGLDLASRAIVVQRYIHMSPLDALILRVSHGDKVSVVINGDERRLIFDNAAVRASPDMRLEAHIGTDKANTVSASNPQAFATLVAPR